MSYDLILMKLLTISLKSREYLFTTDDQADQVVCSFTRALNSNELGGWKYEKRRRQIIANDEH